MNTNKGTGCATKLLVGILSIVLLCGGFTIFASLMGPTLPNPSTFEEVTTVEDSYYDKVMAESKVVRVKVTEVDAALKAYNDCVFCASAGTELSNRANELAKAVDNIEELGQDDNYAEAYAGFYTARISVDVWAEHIGEITRKQATTSLDEYILGGDLWGIAWKDYDDFINNYNYAMENLQ